MCNSSTPIVRARQRKVKHSACGTQKSDILYPVMRFEGCGEITRSAGCGAFYGSPFVSVSARTRPRRRCRFGRRKGRGISSAATAECALQYARRAYGGKSMDRRGWACVADCDCRAAVSKRILDMVYPPASERYQPVSGFDFRCLCRSVPVWATCRKRRHYANAATAAADTVYGFSALSRRRGTACMRYTAYAPAANRLSLFHVPCCRAACRLMQNSPCTCCAGAVFERGEKDIRSYWSVRDFA